MVTAVASPAVSPVSTKTYSLLPQVQRLVSVDILRGLVMVIMALDHTRDFMTHLRFPPEDLARTNGALFFTRFITHYCAPVFAFLAGTGAFLSTSRGKSIQQVSRFFLTRGLWLVLLELTVVDFAWGFVPWAQAGVIWVLGWSMVAMSLLVRLPLRWIATLGLVMVATHNLLDAINPASFGKFSWLWMLLHSPGRIYLGTFLFSDPIRPHSVGRSDVSRFCLWKLTAEARPPQNNAYHRHHRDRALFRTPRNQSLRQRNRRPALRIPTLRRPMEHSANSFVNRDFILQRAQVSAFVGLPADHPRPRTHPARIGSMAPERSKDLAASY